MPGDRIRVVIAEDESSPDRSLRSMVKNLGEVELVDAVTDASAVLTAAGTAQADVLLLDLQLSGVDGVDLARTVRERAGWAVVAVSEAGDPAEFRRVIRAGVKDYLVRPFGPGDLLEAIKVAADGHGNGVSAEPGRAQAVTVAFLSGRGGVGKTTLAVNLACWLASREYRTVLADLDLEFGAAAVLLGLRPERTVVDLCRQEGEITDEAIQGMLTPGHPGQPALLASPPEPHLAAIVDGEGRPQPGRCYVAEIVGGLGRSCDYLIVDTQTTFREATLVALDAAQAIMLVTTPDVPALYHTGRVLDLLLARLNYPPERVRLVVNRYDRERHLSLEEVARGLSYPVSFVVPADVATVSPAGDRGQPFVLARGRSEVCRAVAQIGRSLTGTAVPDPEEDFPGEMRRRKHRGDKHGAVSADNGRSRRPDSTPR